MAAALDDLDLVASARKGQMAAFNDLVERYQSTVYNVCLRMLRQPAPAEDATQETFFAAYRSLKSFRGGSFRGWLLRIAANQCYDQLRERQRHPVETMEDELLLPDPDPRPEEAALSAEAVALLEEAIAQLPPDQRLCVLLIDVQGLDYEEASLAMDLNLGTLKSRLSRARARLRELLAPQFRQMSGE